MSLHRNRRRLRYVF